MKYRLNKTITISAAVLLLIFIALWLVWYLYPVTKEQEALTDTTLTTYTRYIVSADSTDIIVFTPTDGDTLLSKILSPTIRNATASKTQIPAQWIRRWNTLPYNGGTLAVESYDTATICKLTDKQVRTLLERQAENLLAKRKVAQEQRFDIDYYIGTHTVTDNGFDIVARYSEDLTRYNDSITHADSLVMLALEAKKPLRIRLERRYYMETYGGAIECLPISNDKGITKLKLSPTSAQEDITLTNSFSSMLSYTRMNSERAKRRLIVRRPKITKKHLAPIDSIGDYVGDRDSISAPHGYGRFLSFDGCFYEGEWKHGQREGVGFSMIPGKRLMLGEWKEDKYLGERITYTPERVYGIDISRFQHEEGRKRYSIDWKKLRITSLGQISRKTIHGSVNYPVSFIFIKATEGSSIINKYYKADYAAARKYGYRTGAYHFFSIHTTGTSQAEYFLNNSRYIKGDLPPVLDLEPTDAQIAKAGGIELLFRNVRAWLQLVEKRRGVKPILYVSQHFVSKHLPKAPDIKHRYDVWIARYGEYKPDVNLVFWQLCPDGRVNGIHGLVDINVYNGFSLKY